MRARTPQRRSPGGGALGRACRGGDRGGSSRPNAAEIRSARAAARSSACQRAWTSETSSRSVSSSNPVGSSGTRAVADPGGGRPAAAPPTLSEPASSASRPAAARRSVVLPDPFGPTTPTIEPHRRAVRPRRAPRRRQTVSRPRRRRAGPPMTEEGGGGPPSRAGR